MQKSRTKLNITVEKQVEVCLKRCDTWNHRRCTMNTEGGKKQDKKVEGSILLFSELFSFLPASFL